MVKHGEVYEKTENKSSPPMQKDQIFVTVADHEPMVGSYKYKNTNIKRVLATFLCLVVCVALKIKKAPLSFMGKAKYAIGVFS